jgi:FtsP/CotA-like multicopper oxidase with cupredoxin domain
VVNSMNEPTSMHWHGFLQTNANHEDGVPGVTQCPIAPGSSYTYTIKAELYGSSWYHTHYSAQYSGGTVGPIVVYGPHESGYDVDIGPVMLMDWYRTNLTTNVGTLMNPITKGGYKFPPAQSNLINGKMRYPCASTKLPCMTAAYPTFNFTSGKNHRLRLMNTGSGAVQKFAIDGHVMQVIANDFMPINPYNTSMIALGVGQRADVIVHGSGKSGDMYWMRSNIVTCSINDGLLTEARAVIYYQNASHDSLPTAAPNTGPAATTSMMACGNDPLTNTVPAYSISAGNPGVTKEIDIAMKSNGTHNLYYMGNSSFKANFNWPVLSHVWDVNNPISSLPPNRNVWNLGTATSARAVIYNYNDAPHPVHLHGHNFQVLNLGMGKWDGTIIRSSNPQRRDVQVMPPALSATVPSYVVIQWTANNPGGTSANPFSLC